MSHITVQTKFYRFLHSEGRGVPLTSPSLPLWDRTWWDSQPDQYPELKNPMPGLHSEIKNKTHKNDYYWQQTWEKNAI